MKDELSLDEARKLVQARLDSWRTEEDEHFISRVTPFEHGWLFGHGLRVNGTRTGLLGGSNFAVMKTGEVYSTPGVLELEVICELLARNWEATHAPALSAELGEAARKCLTRFFNQWLRDLLRAGAQEARLQTDEDGTRICWRTATAWDGQDAEPWFIGALFARRLKQMADIEPRDLSEPEAMQSGLIKIKLRQTRYQMAEGVPEMHNGRPVIETRRAFYNISLSAFPGAQGEQVVLVIELDEATSTWGSGTTDSLIRFDSL